MMKKRRFGRKVAVAAAVAVIGSMAGLLAFAEENVLQTILPSAAESEVTPGQTELNAGETSRAMNWEYFSTYEDGTWAGGENWAQRMNLDGAGFNGVNYAAILYNTLAEGTNGDGNQDYMIDDAFFAPENRILVQYGNGQGDSLNAVEILRTTLDTPITQEEWSEVRQNLVNSYCAFRKDFPDVFWLNQNPRFSLVPSVITDENGAEVGYDYTLYLVLADNNGYDIRSASYRSGDTIRSAINRRNVSVQEMLDLSADMELVDRIMFFREKSGAVAESMGPDVPLEERSARAFKLLCDNIGVACVLVTEGNGEWTEYVDLGNGWEPAYGVGVELPPLETEPVEEPDTKQPDAGQTDEDQADQKADAEKKKEEEKKKQEDQKAEDRKKAEKAKQELEEKKKAELPKTGAAVSQEAVAKEHPSATVSRAMNKTATKTSNAQLGVLKKEGDVSAIKSDFIISLKEQPVYGDNWNDIIAIGAAADITHVALQDEQGNPIQDDEGNDITYPFDRQYLRIEPEKEQITGAGHWTYHVYYYAPVEDENGEIITRKIKIKMLDDTNKVYVASKPVTVLPGDFMYEWTYTGKLASDFKQVAGTSLEFEGAVGANPISMDQIEVTVKPSTRQGTMEGEGDDAKENVDEGTVEISITQKSGFDSDNYILTGKTLRVPYVVVPKEIEMEKDLSIQINETSFVYDGLPQQPKYTVTVTSNDGELLDPNTDYLVNYRNNINAGTAYASVTCRGGKHYKWSGEHTDTFTIAKASWPDDLTAVKAADTKYGRTGTYDLSELLPSGAAPEWSGSLNVESDPDNILERGYPQITNKTLTYRFKDDPELEGKSAKVVLYVPETPNYFQYQIYITLEVAGKEAQRGFKFSYKERRGQVGTTIPVPASGEAKDSLVTYRSLDPEIASVDNKGNVTLVKEGQTKIVATASETPSYLATETSYDVTAVRGTVELLSQFEADGTQYQLEMERGISSVTPELTGIYPYPSDIEDKLRTELTSWDSQIPAENVAFYDVILKTLNEDNIWENVKEGEFPRGGLQITIPYPEKATDRASFDYKMVHMFTTNANNTPNAIMGDVEYVPVTELREGLQGTVNGLSPIAVGYIRTRENPDNPDNPNNPDDPDNPNNPDDPDNPDNPNNPSNPDNPNNPNNPSNGSTNGNGTTGNGTTNNGTTTGNRTTTTTGNRTTTGTGTTTTGTKTANSGTTNTGTNSRTGSVLTGDYAIVLKWMTFLVEALVTIGVVYLLKREISKRRRLRDK